MSTIKMPDGTLVRIPENPSPEQQEFLEKALASTGRGMEVVKEVGRVADFAGRKGATALFGFAGDSAMALRRAATSGVEKLFFPGQEFPEQSGKWGDVQKALETAGGLLPDVSKPKTELGKGAANVLESVVGAATGGGLANLAQRAMIGLGGGLGGEVAARATDDNPLARVAGSLAGGGVTGLVQSWRPNVTELVQESTKSMRGSDWTKAQIMEAMAKKEGLPSVASQFLGPRSTLDDVVVQASANPAVRSKIVSHLGTAPDKAEELINLKTLESLSPPGGERNAALGAVQTAAEGALKRIQDKAGNAYINAVPEGLERARFTPPQVKAMQDELLALSRASGVGPTSERGKDLIKFATEKLVDPATGRLITSKGYINSLYKDVNALGVNQGYSGLASGDIRMVLKKFTPEFQPARDAYHKVLTQELHPAGKSLIGQIARQGGGSLQDQVTAKKASLDLMFNDGLKPLEIRQFATQVGDDVVSDMLREHIAKSMIKVWPKDIVPLNQAIKAPSTLQGELFGAGWQTKNFNEALAATARANGVAPEPLIKGAKHFFTLLNSYKDVKLTAGVNPGQTAQVAQTNFPGALAEPFGSTRRFFGTRATTDTYEKLAKIVMSPDGVKQLEALGRAPKPERVKALVLSMIAAVESQPDEKEIDNGK